MDESVPFLSGAYLLYLGVLLVSRGLDFLSTWIATPHMVLEGNPIARRLGWKWGAVVNLALCGSFALFPLPAIIIATTSVLVAAHNFDGAWVMRTMGEEHYRAWMSRQHLDAPAALLISCLLAKTALWAAVGVALVMSGNGRLTSTGIGFGLVGYGAAVLLYSSISIWRLRRAARVRMGPGPRMDGGEPDGTKPSG